MPEDGRGGSISPSISFGVSEVQGCSEVARILGGMGETRTAWRGLMYQGEQFSIPADPSASGQVRLLLRCKPRGAVLIGEKLLEDCPRSEPATAHGAPTGMLCTLRCILTEGYSNEAELAVGRERLVLDHWTADPKAIDGFNHDGNGPQFTSGGWPLAGVATIVKASAKSHEFLCGSLHGTLSLGRCAIRSIDALHEVTRLSEEEWEELVARRKAALPKGIAPFHKYRGVGATYGSGPLPLRDGVELQAGTFGNGHYALALVKYSNRREHSELVDSNIWTSPSGAVKLRMTVYELGSRGEETEFESCEVGAYAATGKTPSGLYFFKPGTFRPRPFSYALRADSDCRRAALHQRAGAVQLEVLCAGHGGQRRRAASHNQGRQGCYAAPLHARLP